ncbi:hypothetical protein Hanom_Chr00s000002g01598881 [Helianthus anomalus]
MIHNSSFNPNLDLSIYLSIYKHLTPFHNFIIIQHSQKQKLYQTLILNTLLNSIPNDQESKGFVVFLLGVAGVTDELIKESNLGKKTRFL